MSRKLTSSKLWSQACTRRPHPHPSPPFHLRQTSYPAPSSRLIHTANPPPNPLSRLPLAPSQWRPPHPSSPPHRPLTTRAALRKVFHLHPFSVSLATLLILFLIGTLGYTNYIYKYYIIEQFAAYPEPVAIKLRRAIYYHKIEPDPKLAVKYYRQGLEEAERCGMDAFSDEVIGIKLQLAFLMESVGQVGKAVEVLGIVLRDCMAWVEDPERGGREERRAQRGRVLGKCVGVSVKLGELYADERIGDQESAEERLVWAVTTVLKEVERREREGVREGEGKWMSEEEIGAALESLADHYEARSQHFLAAPLYLQAISLIPSKNCHAITLMNNLSISLALQNPPPTAGIPSPSSASQIDAAKTWAKKALAVDRALQGKQERTAECDEACAVTMVNLGDFAEMEGDLQEARRWYGEGMELSKRVGLKEGVKRGREGLRKLDKRQ